MNFDRMRALLLDRAICGELVPQLTEEGNVDQRGAVLEEVPFKIPKAWKWCTLNEVGKWKAGGTPSRSVAEYYENGTIPWLKTGDLTDGKISTVEEYITKKGVDNSSAHVNPKGAVLIAMYGATIGKLGILEKDCATNQACCACVVKEELVNNWYLFYYLMSQRKKFISLGAGGAQPNISRTKIIGYPIPLPPIAEQVRIVAKLEEAFAEIDCAEKAYKELQTLSSVLKGQIFQEAIQGKLVPQLDSEEEVQQIGDAPEDVPFVIPEKWKWVTLSSLGTTYTGTTPSTSKKEYFGKDIPFVKPGDIDRCLLTYREDGLSSVARDVARLVPKNSLLMVCIGGSIGKVAICDREVSFNQQINAIVSDEESVLSGYLFVVMRSSYFQDEVWGNATGTATPIINKSRWGKILIPLPPIKEQARIVAKVDDLLKHVEALSAR